MTDLTDEQRKSIDVLQSEQDPDVTPEQRMGFMQRILSVKNTDLQSVPKPAPVRRGRTPKHKDPGVLHPQIQ